MNLIMMKKKAGKICSSDGYRPLFPFGRDLLSEGLVENYVVANDKITYAFVKGDQFTADDFIPEELLVTGVVDGTDLRTFCEIAGSKFWINQDYSVYTMVNGKMRNLLDDGEQHVTPFMRNFIDELSRQYGISIDRNKLIELSVSRAKPLDTAEVLMYGTRAYSRYIYTFFQKKKIELSEDYKSLRVTYEDKYVFCNHDNTYIVIAGELVEISSYQSKFTDITDKIETFMLEHSVTNKCIPRAFSSLIVKAFNTEIELHVLDGEKFSYDLYEMHKDKIEENRKELQSFAKRVGKISTTRNIEELRKLSFKNILIK